VWQHGIPNILPRHHAQWETAPEQLPFANLLQKDKRRLLFIVPFLTVGGADKFNLDFTRLLTQEHDYEITIVTTIPGDHSWMPRFAVHTPDIFPLHTFLRLPDYPRFIEYLIRSRQPETVMISNSDLGYQMLPWLRSRCPEVVFGRRPVVVLLARCLHPGHRAPSDRRDARRHPSRRPWW
jgi:hypothetical protein